MSVDQPRPTSRTNETDDRTAAMNAQFRAMFEQATVGIAQAELTGRYVLANPRYCAIVGYTEAELRGLRVQDLTHPDDWPRNLQLFLALVAGGPDFTVEKRYVRKDGSHVWVSNSVTAVRDADGGITGVMAVTIDISDRVRAEAALRESEERLALAQRAARMGTWDWDLVTGDLTWSEGLYLLLDLTPEEITPSATAWRDIVHPDDLPDVARRTEEAIRAGGEFSPSSAPAEKTAPTSGSRRRGVPTARTGRRHASWASTTTSPSGNESRSGCGRARSGTGRSSPRARTSCTG